MNTGHTFVLHRKYDAAYKSRRSAIVFVHEYDCYIKCRYLGLHLHRPCCCTDRLADCTETYWGSCLEEWRCVPPRPPPTNSVLQRLKRLATPHRHRLSVITYNYSDACELLPVPTACRSTILCKCSCTLCRKPAFALSEASYGPLPQLHPSASHQHHLMRSTCRCRFMQIVALLPLPGQFTTAFSASRTV